MGLASVGGFWPCSPDFGGTAGLGSFATLGAFIDQFSVDRGLITLGVQEGGEPPAQVVQVDVHLLLLNDGVIVPGTVAECAGGQLEGAEGEVVGDRCGGVGQLFPQNVEGPEYESLELLLNRGPDSRIDNLVPAFRQPRLKRVRSNDLGDPRGGVAEVGGELILADGGLGDD